MLSLTSQLLPFTSTQESAPLRALPSRMLPLTTPPVVPSLMSTDSAVVWPILLPLTTLRSVRSGWQSLIMHQLLTALPTYTPSPNLSHRRPVLLIVLPSTTLSVLLARRWIASSPMLWMVRFWIAEPVVPSATTPFCDPVMVKPTNRQ